jgi:two-component system, LytTR family, response regulator
MNNKYTCIIVDDEPKAIELLSDSIHDLFGNLEIISTHTSWKTAITDIRSKEFDLLFLDISMPQKNGIDLLALVPELKSEVIFVTAYSEYAMDAFNHFAAGYILKPVKDDVLVKTVTKILERISYKKLVQSKKHNADIKPLIGIPNNNGLDYLNCDEILYLEATSRYTRAVTSQKEIISSYSIGKFKELTDPYPFFLQVHRSFIINLNHVKRYERQGVIIMANGHEVSVSKNMREEFLHTFGRITKIPDGEENH